MFVCTPTNNHRLAMSIEKSKTPSYCCNHDNVYRMLKKSIVLVVFLCTMWQIQLFLQMNNEENLQNKIHPEFQQPPMSLWWSNATNKKSVLSTTSPTLLVADNQHYYVPTKEELTKSIPWQIWCNKYQKTIKEFAPFVDKHAVKQFVAKVAPNLTFAKEYAYINNSQDITHRLLDTKLPDRYMMKANHMSGGLVLVTNRNHTRCLKRPCSEQQPGQNTADYLAQMCQKFLNFNYGKRSGEIAYLYIPRKCIFEQVLDFDAVQDYKIFMFHGRPMIVGIYKDRFQDSSKIGRSRRTPYSWVELPFKEGERYTRIPPEVMEKLRPSQHTLDAMLELSSRLYEGIKSSYNELRHVRIDFFVYGDQFAFAELTFEHSACSRLFQDAIANKFYGYVATHPDVVVDPDAILELNT